MLIIGTKGGYLEGKKMNQNKIVRMSKKQIHLKKKVKLIKHSV